MTPTKTPSQTKPNSEAAQTQIAGTDALRPSSLIYPVQSGSCFFDRPGGV